MSEPLKRVDLWSDFDGTAVEKVGKLNHRNWSKYPLAAIPGYNSFLEGAVGGGLDVRGVVSRRPNFAQRRLATLNSIHRLGFKELERRQVALLGSERRKAEFVAEQASGVEKIAFIDDQPHKFGQHLLIGLANAVDMGIRRSRGYGEEITPLPLHAVLGVVHHDRSEEYTAALVVAAPPDMDVSIHDDGLTISAPGLKLDVIQLQPYSEEAGNQFAHAVITA